jgi:hypothetical protein
LKVLALMLLNVFHGALDDVPADESLPDGLT